MDAIEEAPPPVVTLSRRRPTSAPVDGRQTARHPKRKKIGLVEALLVCSPAWSSKLFAVAGIVCAAKGGETKRLTGKYCAVLLAPVVPLGVCTVLPFVPFIVMFVSIRLATAVALK